MRKRSKHVSEQDVQRVLQPQLDALKDIAIIQLSNNEIEMFGKYSVTKIKNQHRVLRKTDDIEHKFRNSKAAAAWCILDKTNKVVEANRLLELDNKISSLEVEQEIYEISAKDMIGRAIKQALLAETRLKIRLNQKEIDKYITIAHQWQTRGYNNGTIRTSN
jgi:predicted nucleotide-binding protein